MRDLEAGAALDTIRGLIELGTMLGRSDVVILDLHFLSPDSAPGRPLPDRIALLLRLVSQSGREMRLSTDTVLQERDGNTDLHIALTRC